jgi:hypothetical protein
VEKSILGSRGLVANVVFGGKALLTMIAVVTVVDLMSTAWREEKIVMMIRNLHLMNRMEGEVVVSSGTLVSI